MTDITDTELDLDAIEIGARAWSEQLANEARRGPIGTMYVSPWEVRALVAALRSERTDRRSCNVLQAAYDEIAAELKRERTQNAAMRDALDTYVIGCFMCGGTGVVIRPPKYDSVTCRECEAARAALSTQERSHENEILDEGMIALQTDAASQEADQ